MIREPRRDNRIYTQADISDITSRFSQRMYAIQSRCCCAESCTAGLLAGAITSVQGASSVFRGGIIAYSNEVKTSLLGVAAATLDAHGAVSEHTAGEMARGVLRHIPADISIAITGIAGPGGGSKEKPVGLVYIATAHCNKTTIRGFLFAGDRNCVRTAAVYRALSMAVECIDDSGLQ